MSAGFREQLLAALDAAGIAAEVVITQNRATMLSTRAKSSLRGPRLIDRQVRVAERFAALGEEAIGAIVDFVTDAPDAGQRVQALIKALPPDPNERAVGLVSSAPPGTSLVPVAKRLRSRKEPPLRSRGRYHDLAALADEERALHLPGEPSIPVAWGRREGRRRRQLRSIRLGTYEPSGPLVRIHPRLDDPRVPGWFVAFVIFHELLHHALGIRMSPSGDRRELHPPAFRELEARHPRYADALAWEEAHIRALLSDEW